MKHTDRRSALQLALAAAIIPALHPVRALASVPGRLIAPPGVPMRYSRAVSRDLVDGALFTVSRDFAVEFRPFDDGFILHGAQSQVRVDCPDSLAAFADMERSRDESGLFPIGLDPFGQILSGSIAQPATGDLDAAVDRALDALAAQRLAADEREQAARFVSALQQAAQRITAFLPTDLFAPTSRSRRDERTVALPGGAHGSVETVFECEHDSQTGLMRSARRDILTTVAGSTRATHERWSLTAD
ncbi:hypothetical protein [Aurantiacibacter hainanensis]|uniref:hypothetical protein n=1 Tax=Aurantiacibacter hainanensis TaxID=3076114 RepID=UPI0030C70A37